MEIEVLKNNFLKLESDLREFADEQREANKYLQEKVFGLDKTLGILAEGFKAINELQKEIKDLTNLVGQEVRNSNKKDSELSERITVLETKKNVCEEKVVEIEATLSTLSTNIEKDIKTLKEEVNTEKHKDGENAKKILIWVVALVITAIITSGITLLITNLIS